MLSELQIKLRHVSVVAKTPGAYLRLNCTRREANIRRLFCLFLGVTDKTCLSLHKAQQYYGKKYWNCEDSS